MVRDTHKKIKQILKYIQDNSPTSNESIAEAIGLSTRRTSDITTVFLALGIITRRKWFLYYNHVKQFNTKKIRVESTDGIINKLTNQGGYVVLEATKPGFRVVMDDV